MASGGGDRDYKVLVVGSAKVGKTSIIQRYCFDDFSYTVPPTAAEERKVVRVGEKEVPLLICDLAGCTFNNYCDNKQRGRPGNKATDRTDLATRGYYAETHAIIFVYDITNPETLYDSSTWIKDIKIYLNERLTQGLPIIFVGNKKDLVKVDYTEIEATEGEQQPPGQDYATLKQAKHILKDNFPSKVHAEALECSACTGENVAKVFNVVARRLAGEKPTGWCPLF